MDVKFTLLNEDLEEVYVEQPPSFVILGPKEVCKLKKALYKLKQAPLAWYQRIDASFCEMGLRGAHMTLIY